MILWAIVLLPLYAFVCLAAGVRPVAWLMGRDRLASTRPLTQLALGVCTGGCLLSSLYLLLSLPSGGWFHLGSIGLLWGLVVLVGGPCAWQTLRQSVLDIGRVFRNLHTRETLPMRLIAVVTLAVFLMYVLSSFLPPHGDAETYYSVLAKIIAGTHRLLPVPLFESFMTVGVVGELHQAALLAMGSEMAATAMVSVYGLAGVLLLLAIAREIGMGRSGQWMLLALVGCSTLYMRLFYGGKVDIYAAATGIATIYLVMQLARGRTWGTALLAGAMLGWSLQGKVTYLATLVPMAAMLGAWRILASDTPGRLRVLCVSAGAMTLGLGVCLVPHMLKDAVLFGIPWFPIMTRMTGDPGISRPEAYGDRVLLLYPIAPFLTTLNMWGRVSALVVAFLPTLFFAPRPDSWRSFLRSPRTQVMVTSTLGFLAWAVVVWRTSIFIPRYLLPTLILLGIVPVWGAEQALRRGGRLVRGAVYCSVIMALAMTINRPKTHPDRAFRYVFGLETRSECISPEGRMALAINEHARLEARVFTWTPYRYNLRADLLPQASTEETLAELARIDQPELQWRRLYAMGFRYLLHHGGNGQVDPQRPSVRIPLGDGTFLDSQHLPVDLRLDVLAWEITEDRINPPIIAAAFVLKSRADGDSASPAPLLEEGHEANSLPAETPSP